MDIKNKIPSAVIHIITSLEAAGFKAYIVGGALRDIILGRHNPDFDIATSALPSNISSVFPNAIPYGDFGTMLVISDDIKVEVTPFRDDAPGRKPDYTFGGNIYTDLSRRDFTINSMAYDLTDDILIDPFNGQKDIAKGIIKCTGNTKRIWEDPLRAMRAARFQAQLGFTIDPSTLYALKTHASNLAEISRERIRDELIKLITGDYPFEGLVTLIVTDLMKYIIPELLEGQGIIHYNKPMDVLEHNMVACKIVKNTPILRLAALLHDVGKPHSLIQSERGHEFPGHHTKSALIAEKILKNLHFDSNTIKKVVLLIEHHMFYYSPQTPISEARRLISKVGWENIYDLIELRKADRLASGFEKAVGEGLQKLINNLEILKKENSDYRLKDLAVNGEDIIKELKVPAGPMVGEILNKLLEQVILNPEINTRKKLLEMASSWI